MFLSFSCSLLFSLSLSPFFSGFSLSYSLSSFYLRSLNVTFSFSHFFHSFLLILIFLRFFLHPFFSTHFLFISSILFLLLYLSFPPSLSPKIGYEHEPTEIKKLALSLLLSFSFSSPVHFLSFSLAFSLSFLHAFSLFYCLCLAHFHLHVTPNITRGKHTSSADRAVYSCTAMLTSLCGLSAGPRLPRHLVLDAFVWRAQTARASHANVHERELFFPQTLHLLYLAFPPSPQPYPSQGEKKTAHLIRSEFSVTANGGWWRRPKPYGNWMDSGTE